jgi:hypothetical protein
MKLNANEKIILRSSSIQNFIYAQSDFHGVQFTKKVSPVAVYLTNQRIYVEDGILHSCAFDLSLHKIQNIKIERLNPLIPFTLPFNLLNPKGLLIQYRKNAELKEAFLKLGNEDLKPWLNKIEELKNAKI